MTDDPAARYNRLARWHGTLTNARLDAALAEADREQADLRNQIHDLRRKLATVTRERDQLARTITHRPGQTTPRVPTPGDAP